MMMGRVSALCFVWTPQSDCRAVDAQWSNGNDEHAIAQSLPIPIGLNGRMQGFGKPSFQQKTLLSDRPGLLVPALHQTSSSLRRASYAERDRTRPVDPGALDFAADDDYDDDVDSDPETGGKARQRALKILKARNEMPAAGEVILLLPASVALT